MPEQTTQTTNNTSHQSAADDVVKQSLAAKSFKNLEPVKHFLSNIDYSYTKNAFVIDKGHIRSVEGVKNLIQGTINIMNDLSLNDYWLIDKNNMSEDLQKFSGEDFLSHLKDSDLANVGKNIDPVKDKMFMPIKVDVGNKIGKWYPVIINEDADSFKKVINGYQGYHDTKALKMLRNLLKRHTNANKGLFEASKIKFSNVDLNSGKKVLDDSVIKESKAKKIGKGLLNYVTGNSFFSSKRGKAKKFNKKYGIDEDGNKMGDTDKKDNDGTLVAKNIQADSGPEEKKSNNKEDFNSEIKERAKKFIENNLGMIPEGKLSMPFRKLTTKGLLADIRLSVKLYEKGPLTTLTSTFKIEFGKKITLYHMGSELIKIPDFDINLLEGDFIVNAHVDTLLCDAGEGKIVWITKNPSFKFKIGENETTASAENLTFKSGSETPWSGKGIKGILNINLLNKNFKGQIQDFDFEDNEPTMGFGIGKLDELDLNSRFKAENVAGTWMLLNDENHKLVLDAKVGLKDLKKSGIVVETLSGRLISNFSKEDGWKLNATDLSDGNLNGTFLGQTVKLTGVNYSSTAPNEVSAEEGKWKGNVYSKDISVTITNPKIDDQKGFTFDTATGKISELNLSNVLKLQNIEVSVEKDNDNYELKGESDVKGADIKGLKMLGKEVIIKGIGGKVKYNSHNDNKLSAEDIYINVSIEDGETKTTINLKEVNITKDGNLSVEKFTAKYTDTKFEIDQDLTGEGVSFENSELTFKYLKASGLGLEMTEYDFLTAKIHSIKVYNKNKKAIEIGFLGSVKKVFQKGPGEDQPSGFDARLGGIIGWDFSANKYILKIEGMRATGSVKNPLKNLGDLIKEFSSGRVDIGASIPVFPGIFAEFGFFLEAAIKLGGGNLVFSADLNSEKNQIHLTMEPLDVASGYIAAGVYAGIKAGSKFLVAVSVYLEALGKASVTSEINYKSILDFNDPKSLKFIHQEGSFFGFGYSLEAEMKFAAQLKAITQAFYFLKNVLKYPLAEKTIGKFKYSSEKPEGDFSKGDTLVEDKEFKKEVKPKFKNKTITQLLKLNSETDFSGSESTVAKKFTDDIGYDSDYKKNIGKDLNVKEKIKAKKDRLGERYHKRYLVNIRKLNSRLTNLNNISDFQHNRFPESSFTSDLASKETNEDKESFVEGIKSHKAYNDKHSLILKSFSTHEVLEKSAKVSLGSLDSVVELQSAHTNVKKIQTDQIEKLEEIVKFKNLKAIDMTEEEMKSFRESLLAYDTEYNQGYQASKNLKSKIRNEERSFNAEYYRAKKEEIDNQFKEQKLESTKKAKESSSYLSDDFSADYKNITEEKN